MSSCDSNISSSQSNFIVNIICNIFTTFNRDIVSVIVRKFAHFTEYFILGILSINMINSYGKRWYVAVIICVLYAISDEMHQLFVSGRSCQITDILIDSLGSTCGILLLNKIKIKKNI